ncbi:MAG: hypothetical protein COA45_01860 [Zetaproteobacteria bacterium]|nr:MAG: hypothetical protein COA45_01860 [Zetaproteobacteria bacterium]
MYIPEALKTYGVIISLIVASFWFASQFIAPTPPKTITLAAGSKGGEYYRYATLYKSALAAQGVEVNIIETAGSIDNIELLLQNKTDIAFIQSGLATPETQKNIETLSSLYYEPIWVFVREDVQEDVRSAKDLQRIYGKTVAIGRKGSGTNALMRRLLEGSFPKAEVSFVEISGEKAVSALQNRAVDAAVFVGRSQSPHIQSLLRDKTVHLLSFVRADGYARLYPFLSKVVLSEGVIDMAENIPNYDLSLISPVAQLTVSKGFSGALKTLLVRTAFQLHGDADVFAKQRHFPTLEYADFPISEEARRYFEYGPNFLQRVLPFWLADLINRMIVMLIPLIGVMIPLLKVAPPTYRWQTRSKIYKWYKDLKKIEEAAATSKAEDKNMALSFLEKIDEDVKKTKVPLSYADELYNLRLHIKMIKDRLQK